MGRPVGSAATAPRGAASFPSPPDPTIMDELDRLFNAREEAERRVSDARSADARAEAARRERFVAHARAVIEPVLVAYAAQVQGRGYPADVRLHDGDVPPSASFSFTPRREGSAFGVMFASALSFTQGEQYQVQVRANVHLANGTADVSARGFPPGLAVDLDELDEAAVRGYATEFLRLVLLLNPPE